MQPFASALALLMAAPATNEVEFNCPWCNTRLALTRADFEKERAVLCPRCSNPIDLDIQRRLARTTTVTKPRGAPMPPPPMQKPAPPARVDRPPAAPRYSDRPQAPLEDTAPRDAPKPPTPPGQPSAPPPAGTPPAQAFDGMSDWTKPLDIDTRFSATPRPGPTVTGASSSKAPPTNTYGGKIICPSCGYENARVPPEFSFGTQAKCSWCSKPLPDA